MAQHSSKKPSSAHPKSPAAAAQSAANIASLTANKAAAAALSAVESSRSSAESMVRLSTETMKEFFSNSTGETQKNHEKVFALSRESAENVSRMVEAMTRTINDMVSLARENTDAAVEVSHITADVMKSINTELASCANTSFSDNVDLCKEMFACRNINDMFDIQSKWFSTNMDAMFSQSTRIAEMMFQLANEAAEPLNERLSEATERFSKSLAA